LGNREKWKINLSCPPNLKRNKSKAPWAFPLAERKINPLPRPPNKTCMESSLSAVQVDMDCPLSTPKLHSTVRPASGEASFSLYYIKHAQDLQGLSRAQPARAGHRQSQSAPLPCPARTGPAGTLPCPAHPCWPPSQPVSPSPVPSTGLNAELRQGHGPSYLPTYLITVYFLGLYIGKP